MTIVVIGTSRSSSEVINGRNAEVIFVDGGGVLQVSMVNSPSMEVQLGGYNGCAYGIVGVVFSVGNPGGEV